MSSIQIMGYIPGLSPEESQWCVNAVYYVISADRVIQESEREIIEDLADRLGAEVPSGDIESINDPPDMTLEEKQFVLRMLLLASWIDGDYSKIEKKKVQELINFLDVDEDLIELAHLEVRKAIFLSSMIGSMQKIICSSSVGRELIERLGFSEKEIDETISEWRNRI